MQLDFFEDYDEVDCLRYEIKELKESQDRLRKGLFQRLGDLSKLYLKLEEDLDRVRLLLIQKKK